MTIRETVLERLRAVAKQQNKTLAPLTDNLLLLESGLDSLCVALVVADLEDETGLDPFGSGDAVPIPRTIGDLIAVYEHAAG